MIYIYIYLYKHTNYWKIFGFCSFFIFGVCLTTLFEVCFCQQYRNECNNTFLWCIVCSFFVIFSFDHCRVVLFGLCHLVGLMVFGLILQKIYAPNISANNCNWKKNSGNNANIQFFGLNIFHAWKMSRP